ncbi:protein BREAKING OF ASYMMETRY IN THE STOMATAL LINEAGE [Coffea arabica]|uniref:Protein BREAKING OF ASYMMETRY IN THE STOMATAL LINEAGE n=1 Tax=Coffea arabica TaxID=13443 RepID=A0A6P6X4Q6_COFAR
MSTTTITQLVRWRVRHLAACLYACRLPLIDEPDCSTSTDEVPEKKMVFDPIGESRRSETSRQKSRRKNRDQERASPENPKQKSSSKRSEDRRGESSMSSFAEEEYIVFCFTDDGEIQMVKEKRSSGASHGPINPAKRRSRRVNDTTQNCGENAEGTSIPSHVAGDTALCDEHAEEEGSNDVEVECIPDEIKEINHYGPHECRTLSSMLSVAESSDSNQSDASTGSFAFPILGRDWMGSPVHMPKPEDVHLQKHKARVVRLNCCRF